MSKLEIAPSVDKKTEVNELLEEMKKIINEQIDSGEAEHFTALELIALITHDWVMNAIQMTNENNEGTSH